MTYEFHMYGDIIDIRDIIERIEELRGERDDFVVGAPDGTETPAPDLWESENAVEAAELYFLEGVMSDLKGYGGDEQWEGDWYPLSLVADDHFEEYARDLAEDIGAINPDATWPNNCIDWERAARELKFDYSSVEIEGSTYWYR